MPRLPARSLVLLWCVLALGTALASTGSQETELQETAPKAPEEPPAEAPAAGKGSEPAPEKGPVAGDGAKSAEVKSGAEAKTGEEAKTGAEAGKGAEAKKNEASAPLRETESKPVKVTDDEKEKEGEEKESGEEEEPGAAKRGEEKIQEGETSEAIKEFNRLKREEHKFKEEIRAKLGESNRARNTLIVLIAIIISLTLIFEWIMENVSEAVEETLKPMVESVFRELTLLGFISLFTFLAVKTRIPGKVSKLIFDTTTELHEMFEIVHFIVFFFMLFFVVLTVFLVLGGKRVKRWWISAEALCTDVENSGPEIIRSDYVRFVLEPVPLCSVTRHRARTEAYHNMDYLVMRCQFQRELETEDSKFRGFDFAQYLANCHDHSVGRAVELQPRIWFMLLFSLIPLRAFIQIGNMNVKVWLFTILGYILLLMSFIFLYKLRDIKKRLTGVPFPSPRLATTEPQVFEAMRLAGVKWLESQRPPYKAAPFDGSAYTKHKTMRKFLGSTGIPDQQTTMFWFQDPGLMFQILQAFMLLMSIHSAMFVFRFSKFMLEESYLLLVLNLFPIAITSMWTFPMGCSTLMQVTSIGLHKNTDQIKNVDLQVKTRKMVKTMKVLQGMRLAKLHGAGGDAERTQLVSRIPFDVRQRLHHHFQILDADGSGDLRGDEVTQLLQHFGISRDKLRSVDDGWGLTFEDMLALYADLHTGEGDRASNDKRDLVDSVFDMLDVEGHGSISPDEFIRSMREQTDPKHQLTDRECFIIFREADANNDGMLDKGEFHKLMKTYMHE